MTLRVAAVALAFLAAPASANAAGHLQVSLLETIEMPSADLRPVCEMGSLCRASTPPLVIGALARPHVRRSPTAPSAPSVLRPRLVAAGQARWLPR